jgi:hypothetical protein
VGLAVPMKTESQPQGEPVKRLTMLILALALVAAGCGGGEASCTAIMDDGLELFQDALDELAGMTLTDLSNPSADPFTGGDFESRTDDLDRRTREAGCTDEEMSELFAERVDELEVGSNNPAGQFLVSILKQTAESGEFSVDFSS